MGMDSQIALGNDARRYELLARFASSPWPLGRQKSWPAVLAGELRRVLDFDFLMLSSIRTVPAQSLAGNWDGPKYRAESSWCKRGDGGPGDCLSNQQTLIIAN